jgi:hypothetical protein
MIEAIATLLTEIFKLVNTENSRKYIDRVAEIRIELLNERGKGQLSDDAKIERLEKELIIILEAAKADLEAMNAKK